MAQKINGFQIFASAVFVWDPLALLSRIIEVEHGSDSVYPQAVDVIFVQPEEAAGEEKAAHFVAAVVEDEGFPVGMKTFARVGVFKQVRAVEVGQPVRVSREVRWHPVQNHPDALLVQIVHIHEILRRTIARGGSKISCGLVSP